MTPSTAQVLMISAGELAVQIAPALPEQFLQGAAQLAAILAILAAQEAERGAAVRAAENAALRKLFATFAPLAGQPLCAELEAAAQTKDDDLHVGALDAANARLRRLLIALQETVEGARALDAERAIWQVLADNAARREFYLPAG